MPESRKNHQSDGEQPKDGDPVALDGDKEFRTSRVSLSKEKASPDGAHEKLLQKEDEAKIVRDMRVDMVDAKFVSGDQRNGDPKIELDANKKQFSGLTKEELMKYAEDPFWVNLRWFMFVLFWLMWFSMLAGAIAIIVRAPKCALAPPRTWFEKGPLVEMKLNDYNFSDIEGDLPLLKSSKIEGIFVKVNTYDALDKPDVLKQFKAFVEKAKEYSVKVIVDLIPNYVPIDHIWFRQSENKSAPYTDYFVWAPSKGSDGDDLKNPNNWVSTLNQPAWNWSDTRKEFYLHQYDVGLPDLNFNNKEVLKQLTTAVGTWMAAGAGGIRLNKARLMVVDPSLPDEGADTGRGAAKGAGHGQYEYYRHSHTADQPRLEILLKAVMASADDNTTMTPEETLFTLKEERVPELFLLERPNATELRPASSAPISVMNVTSAALRLNERIEKRWPIVQLTSEPSSEKELALFALLLPAAPIFEIEQLDNDTSSDSLSHLAALRQDNSVEHGQHSIVSVPGVVNGTNTTGQLLACASDSLSHLAALRQDNSVEHGQHSIVSVPGVVNGTNTTGQLLACARWKAGHTGYVSVFNPSSDHLRANLTSLSTVPDTLTVYHMSSAVRVITDYTNNFSEKNHNVLVPAKSTVILSYVPQITAEN